MPRIEPSSPTPSDHSLTYNRVSKARVAQGPDPGSFRPNGSFDPLSPQRSPAYDLVQKLIDARQLGATPCEIALMVKNSRFPDILGSSLIPWTNLPSPDLWPLAIQQSATSAASTISRFRAFS